MFTQVIELARKNFVVAISGGGTHISKALIKAGFEIHFDDEHGRITETLEERLIARNVLEKEAQELQDALVGKGVVVVPPTLDVGGVLCHVNGDNYVKASYLGFDEIYLFTLKSHVAQKQQIFSLYPKVQIIGV